MARKKTEREKALEFAVQLTVLLGGLAALWNWGVWKFSHRPRLALVLLFAAPLVCLVAAAIPPLWVRIYRGFLKLGEAISWVMTRVLLTVFYFVVLTPIALVMKLLGKAPMDLDWKDGKSSYWIDKESVPESTPERYGRLY